MAENTEPTVVPGTVESDENPEKKPNFLVRFKNRFPRATRVLAILAGLLALVGVGFAVASKNAGLDSEDSSTDDTEDTTEVFSLSDSDTPSASEA
jgi:hypothetical protein